MTGNIALDVFIGLVFIFLLYSLLATIIQEMIATRFGFRAKVLEKAILRMLEDGKTTTRLSYGDRILGLLHLFGLKNLMKDKTVAPWFYAHPLIKYLAEDNFYSKPAYLTADNFSKVILDLLKGFNRPESEIIQAINDSIIAGVIHKIPIDISSKDADNDNPAIKVLQNQNPSLPKPNELRYDTVVINPNTKLFLQSIWRDSGADLNVFRQKLEQWFEDTMERSTGWYKKYTRILLLLLGFIVAVVFNVDTIAIHRILSTNETARNNMVQLAISSRENLDPNKLLTEEVKASDSLLRETYKLVASDAQKANDILGLGNPWKDSCETCEKLAKCGTNTESLKQSIADSIRKEEDILKDRDRDKSYFQMKIQIIDSSLKSGLNKDSIIELHLAYTDSLKELLSKDYTDKKFLARQYHDLLLISRCEVISKRDWLQYSPNQRGGWETLLGWLITALAITLGAPFWFDLLSKLIKIRGAGTLIDPGQNSPPTGSTNPPTAPNSGTTPTININSNSGEEAVG